MAKVQDLTGALLALWVARHDPRCEGLRWDRVEDYWIGFGTIGSSPEFPCLIITDAKPIDRVLLSTKHHATIYAPHEDWAQGGPIISANAIAFVGEPGGVEENGQWCAYFSDGPDAWEGRGETHLIAAMRARVASKYGDTVPDEVA